MKTLVMLRIHFWFAEKKFSSATPMVSSSWGVISEMRILLLDKDPDYTRSNNI